MARQSRLEAYKKARQLRDENPGMTVEEACTKTDCTTSAYYYYDAKRSGRKWAHPTKGDAPTYQRLPPTRAKAHAPSIERETMLAQLALIQQMTKALIKGLSL